MSAHALRWRRAAVCAAAVALGCMGAAPTTLAQDHYAVQARDVLARHCARCHDADQLENPPAKGLLGNILDVEAIARQPHLIRAGDPDASRLYQIMLSRHRPLDAFFGPVPGPSLSEIQNVRDWIAGITPADNLACKDRDPVTAADVARDIKGWRKSFAKSAPNDVRFVSLAHLYNACVSDEHLAAYRAAVTALVAGLSKSPQTPAIDVFSDSSTLLALRPKEAGWSLEDWDQLAGVAAGAVIDGDQFAARVQGRPDIYTASRATEVLAASSTPAVAGLDAVTALAAEYLRDVPLERAAAEAGALAAKFDVRLASVKGDTAALAHRLRQGPLPRAEWQALRANLDDAKGLAEQAASPGGPMSGALRVSLWSEATAFKQGDLLTVNAQATADCYLTIIAVEPNGQATVLFPNDFEQDNRLTAGRAISVPASGAQYLLRLDKPGSQGLVGICHANAKRPEGIGHDFERQRFTSLGDWRAFLATSNEKEAEYQRIEENGRKFRARRRGADAPEKPAEQLPVGTENEGRAGLSIEVR